MPNTEPSRSQARRIAAQKAAEHAPVTDAEVLKEALDLCGWVCGDGLWHLVQCSGGVTDKCLPRCQAVRKIIGREGFDARRPAMIEMELSKRAERAEADRARDKERIGKAEQERDDYKEATADVLAWLRGRLESTLASHKDAKPEDKAFWVSIAAERRTAIHQVENIEARHSPRRIRALLEEVPDDASP